MSQRQAARIARHSQRYSGRRLDDYRQGAGPEPAGQQVEGGREPVSVYFGHRDAVDQQRERPARLAPLGLEDLGDRVQIERVGNQDIQRVARDRDDFTVSNRLGGGRDSLRVRCVERRLDQPRGQLQRPCNALSLREAAPWASVSYSHMPTRVDTLCDSSGVRRWGERATCTHGVIQTHFGEDQIQCASTAQS